MRTTIFDDMRRMQREMDELFSDIWGETLYDKPLLESKIPLLENNRNERGIMQAPQTDVWETDKEIHVKIDMPGVDKKDITITPLENGIEIEAQKTREKEEKNEKKGYHRMERSSIGYKRIIALPRTADNEKAKAKYNNGVLEIIMPKKAEIKNNKRILIE